MNQLVLKISVLSAGVVLLDGEVADQNQLEAAFKVAKANGGSVWYYRQPSADSREGTRVMNMIIQHSLPLILSSKPDFSDLIAPTRVDDQRASGGFQTAGNPGSPNSGVDRTSKVEEIFAGARRGAAGENGIRRVVLVSPHHKYLMFAAPAITSAMKDRSGELERFLPASPRRNVAVIAHTDFSPQGAERQALPSLVEVNARIPFFGLLIGLSAIGHAVWIFEGDAEQLEAGCRNADLLIVDSDLLPLLHEGWQDKAVAVMRNDNILIHDRKTYKLLLRQVPGRSGKLQFSR